MRNTMPPKISSICGCWTLLLQVFLTSAMLSWANAAVAKDETITGDIEAAALPLRPLRSRPLRSQNLTLASAYRVRPITSPAA